MGIVETYHMNRKLRQGVFMELPKTTLAGIRREMRATGAKMWEVINRRCIGGASRKVRGAK